MKFVARTNLVIGYLVMAAMLCAIPALGQGPGKERKLLLVPSEQGSSIPTDVFAEPGLRNLATYDAMFAIAVPAAAGDRIAEHLAGAGFDVIELSDVIRTPGRTLDTGVGRPSHAPFEEGLFLLQFVAPATPAWQSLVRQSGITVVDALPERAAIVAATARQVAVIARFPWVQYAGPYLPEYKSGPIAAEDHREFIVQVVETPGSAASVQRIKERVGGFLSESRYGSEVTAVVQTDLATARALIEEPFVVSVDAYIPPQPSDERQALAVTGATVPSPSITPYLSWLAARGITPNALTNSGIVVDVADTGIDLGCLSSPTRHDDLKGRVVYHNGTTGGLDDPPYEDRSGHGTTVASIVGGNPATGIDTAGTATTGLGYRDNDTYGAFYFGLGVAPGVRIGNTKVVATDRVPAPSDWTRLAVTQKCNTPNDQCPATPSGPVCSATVQNHSTNEYTADGSNAGAYTADARQFDILVRDANLSDGSIVTPLTITMSAGNYGQNTTDTTKEVMASATAKNVIAVGAVESARTTMPAECASDSTGGVNPELRHLAQGYDVLAFCSRRGTDDGRLKPDLLAPATLAFGAHTLNIGNTAYCAKGGDSNPAASYPYPQYHGSSGTSFSAPVAAGAVALLRFHFGTSLSPAMYKAMLVAGGRSITGKLDRLETHLQGATRTVTKWPNAQQGFGVLTLNDLLNTAVQKSRHDQATILLTGQIYERTVTVADPSKPVRIALAWTDAPAAVGATKVLVNDLDLRATGSTFRIYGNLTVADGWSTVNPGCGRPVCANFDDRTNNVEVLNMNPTIFADPANRTFTVQVRGAIINGIGVPGQSGGVNNQDFALFVLNGTLQ